jgi:hypothetical protein
VADVLLGVIVDTQSPVGHFDLKGSYVTNPFFKFSMISVAGLNAYSIKVILGDSF